MSSTKAKSAEHKTVRVPSRAFLEKLPQNTRGEKWCDDEFPAEPLEIETDALLAQLRTGKVILDIADCGSSFVSSGWLRPDASGPVEIDLAEVVAAVPEDLLEPRTAEPEAAKAVAAMPDFFHPAESLSAAETSQTANVTDASDTAPSPGKTTPGRSSVSGSRTESDTEQWDGIEPDAEYAPHGIDINRSDAKTLASLDGISPGLAQDMVNYRNEKGPFSSIFDLSEIPGIGPAVFKKITGVSLKSRTNRHHLLKSLLELPTENGPFLVKITESISNIMNGRGCVLTNTEGTVLAATESVQDEAERHAALGADFVSRTSGQIEAFTTDAPHSMMLPGCNPPILLVSDETTVLVILLEDSSIPSANLEKLQKALSEISWVLSPRAAVIN